MHVSDVGVCLVLRSVRMINNVDSSILQTTSPYIIHDEWWLTSARCEDGQYYNYRMEWEYMQAMYT